MLTRCFGVGEMRKGINDQLLTRRGAGDLGSAGRIAGGGRSECHLEMGGLLSASGRGTNMGEMICLDMRLHKFPS